MTSYCMQDSGRGHRDTRRKPSILLFRGQTSSMQTLQLMYAAEAGIMGREDMRSPAKAERVIQEVREQTAIRLQELQQRANPKIGLIKSRLSCAFTRIREHGTTVVVRSSGSHSLWYKSSSS